MLAILSVSLSLNFFFACPGFPFYHLPTPCSFSQLGTDYDEPQDALAGKPNGGVEDYAQPQDALGPAPPRPARRQRKAPAQPASDSRLGVDYDNANTVGANADYDEPAANSHATTARCVVLVSVAD